MFMQRNVAYLLLIVMLGLIALGLVMLTSTSAMLAAVGHGGGLQQPAAAVRLAGHGRDRLCFSLRYDYQKILRWAPWGVGVAAVLLVLCLIPHVGVRVNGSPAVAAARGLDLPALGIREAGADSFPFVVDGEKSAPCPRVGPRLSAADRLHRAAAPPRGQAAGPRHHADHARHSRDHDVLRRGAADLSPARPGDRRGGDRPDLGLHPASAWRAGWPSCIRPSTRTARATSNGRR